MKAPKWLVTAATPSGSICYRDVIDAYSEKGAVEKAKDRDDGRLACANWPTATWAATPKSKSDG